MAFILQLEEHIARQIGLVVYPDGLTSPSITGNAVKVITGFPIKSELDSDLGQGISVVSVFPVGGMERNVTRYLREWTELSRPDTTIFLELVGNEITVSGAADAEQVCLVRMPDGDYSYETVSGDTLDIVATNLASSIPGATALGSVITLPVSTGVSVFVSVYVTMGREVKRQQKVYNMFVWSPTVTSRAIIGDAIDLHFAENTRQLLLADDFYIYFFYHGTIEEDMLQKHNIFKRCLEYNVEYPTVVTKKFNTLVVTDINLITE